MTRRDESMIVNGADSYRCASGALRHHIRPRIIAVILPLAACAFVACTADKRAARVDTGDAQAGGRQSIATQGLVNSNDSLTQATGADLEQILFSQDAPPGFPQQYWALGRRIYDARRYAPLWSGPDSASDKRAMRTELLCRAHDEGIALELPVPATPASRAFGRRVDSLARRDLSLTFALVQYFTTAARGAVSPASVGAHWYVPQPAMLPDATIASLVSAPESAAVAQVMPASPQYALLSGAYNGLMRIDARGGWPPDSALLHSGARGASVTSLRRRLVLSGDLAPAESAGTSYTAAVVNAVSSFQRRMGLAPDGRVGPGTRAALNMPASARARIVAANLERYRWLPRTTSGQVVILDVAAGSASVSRGGAVITHTRLRVTPDCSLHIPPVIADTVVSAGGKDNAFRIHLARGDSVLIRAPAASRGASACLVVDDVDVLRSALAAPVSTLSPATEMYLIWPTAFVAPDSTLMFRQPGTDADARLDAQMPRPSATRPPVCDSLATSRGT